jgi:phosphopantothenoylcysteine synthetase/decarboxylase
MVAKKKLNTKKPKVISALGFFNIEYVSKINLYQMVFLRQFIPWFSDVDNSKMTKIHFVHDNVGGWISIKTMAPEWGMTALQLAKAIKKLNRPIDPNDPTTQIIISVRVANTKKGKGRGSRTFIVLNPAMINKIICWEALTEKMSDKIKYGISLNCCDGKKEEEQLKNFMKLAKLCNEKHTEYSSLIKTGLEEKPYKDGVKLLLNKMNKKNKPVEAKLENKTETINNPISAIPKPDEEEDEEEDEEYDEDDEDDDEDDSEEDEIEKDNQEAMDRYFIDS